MKTTVIQLENFDNRSSILEKISRVKSGRILLIWPRRSKLHLTEVDFVLLLRKAEEHSLRLAFVCRNEREREQAEAHGISCFLSVPEAERSYWVNRKAIFPEKNSIEASWFKNQTRNNRQLSHSKKSNRIIRSASLILVVISILSLLLFLIPSATVILIPRKYEKEIVIEIWASEKVNTVNVNGTIPLYIRSVNINGEKSLKSSGLAAIPEAYANGIVELSNLTNQEINFPAGTVVSTNSEDIVRFVTLNDVVLPASKLKKTNVNVKALLPGSQGNIEANQIQVVEGNQGGLVEVTNPEPITGGQDSLVASPSKEDYERLRDELIDELSGKAAEMFNKESGFNFLPGSVKVNKIVMETQQIKPGDPGENATLSMEIEFSGSGYLDKDIELLVNQIAATSMKEEEQVYQVIDYTADLRGMRFSENGEFRWQEAIKVLVGQRIDARHIAQIISGKKYSKITQELSRLIDLEEPPKFVSFLSPFFLPFAEFRINVEVR